MRNGFLLSLTALVLGTGLATAQSSKAVKPIAFLPPVPSQPPMMLLEPNDPSPPGARFDSSVPMEQLGPGAGPGGEEGAYCSTCYSAFASGLPDGPDSTLDARVAGHGPCGTPGCGPGGVYWVDLEALFWWTRSVHLPPLVTTSPASSAGILGNPGTAILYGNDNVDQGVTGGGRVVLGVWLNDEQTCGLEGNYLFLGDHAKNAQFAGNSAPGSPVVARPFFNVNSNAEDSSLVSFPGLLAGSVNVRTATRFAGGEINILSNACCGPRYRVDLLAGFRYFELNDALSIDESSAVVPNALGIISNRFLLTDQFDTSNRFFGGNVGVKGEVRLGNFYSDFTGKVAIGGSQEVVTINGSTTIVVPGGAAFNSPGGLLAQPSNIGHYTHKTFAVLPEAGIDVGYQITKNIRVYAGGTFLYLSHAARSGDQIDRGLNPAQFPINGINPLVAGLARPAFTFRDTDFWAQGARVGLEFRY
jgi:hypothetical protein